MATDCRDEDWELEARGVLCPVGKAGCCCQTCAGSAEKDGRDHYEIIMDGQMKAVEMRIEEWGETHLNITTPFII